MTHRAFLVVFILISILFGSCTADQKTTDGRPDATPETPAVEEPLEGVADLMARKLLHSHALLDAISVRNLRDAEYRAMRLTWLSDQAYWRVHDTPEYYAFSERFRDVTSQLVVDAESGDIVKVREGYLAMIGECLDCHAYLHEAGLVRDMPGVFSLLERSDDSFVTSAN